MQTVSATFIDALTGSHKPFCKADVWYAGEIVAPNLDIVSGQVDDEDDGDSIRHRLSLTVADPDGLLVPRSESDPLAPFGSVVNVRAGIELGNGESETVSMGWFRLQTADAAESWRIYDRDDGPEWVSGGARVALTAVDLVEIVKDSRFLAPEQPVESMVRAEIIRITKGLVPVGAWPGVTDAAVPASVTYTDDRWAAVCDLADVLDAIPDIDPYGDLVLRPNMAGVSVWRVAGGEEGVLVDASTRLTRDGIYNAVISRGEGTTDQASVQATRTESGGALRWDGPFGRVPYFHSSPLITTAAQAAADAQTTLIRLVQRRSFALAVECVFNPALLVGDTVTVGLPVGDIDGRITDMVRPLPRGRMTMTVVVPRDLFWALRQGAGVIE